MGTTIGMNDAQRGVWLTERAGVAGAAYRMALGIWFGVGLDEAALEDACAAVAARHPALATAVAAAGGEPVLVPAAGKISLVRGGWSEARVRSEIARPFDLERGPLARFTLLAAAPGRHLLLVTAHHLVFDGVSKDVLAHDLAAAYRAARAGEPAHLPPAPAPAAQQPMPDGGRLARAREFWSARWSPPADAVLPGLRRMAAAAGMGAGGPGAGGPGAAVPVPVPAAVAARLDAAARGLGLTRFELLFAALLALLARYGNAGLPVSVALSTRGPQTAREIGLFVNELPVAVAATGGTFRRYAEAVRARLREVYQVRAVPLAHAVGGLRPAAALTPVSVSYRRQPAEPVFAGVATSVEWSPPTGAARNALHVHIVDAPPPPSPAGCGGVRISLQYRPEALAPAAAGRVAAHLSTVLAAVVDDPDRPVAALPILPAGERALVVDTWNATARRWPAGASVPALFAVQVRERPDAVAVVDAGHALTYAELDRAVDALAAVLRDRGAGRGSLVAVCLPRSWQAVVALLAVMRCGAAYVPVDPAYPARRRELILADAAPVLTLDSVPPLPGTAAPVAPAHPGAADLAYVMYTSGSTGRPKGVAVPHGALANLLLGMAELLGSGPQDRWLALTSLSFDISGLELFLPLVTGARVVVASDVAAADGVAIDRLVRRHGVDHVQATPSGWRILLDAGFDGRPGTVALAGGEALPPALARELRARVGRLFNVYGPTETTIWSTAEELPEQIDEVTIGRPIANTRAYLLDPARQPVPVGIPGELYLAGAGVADGYLHRPELTAERFVPDPVDPAGGRCYRTGDRCRWLPDGRLAYLGRLDNQVKIRGHRVELGEIEAALLTHPAVAEAAVVYGGSRLVGYLVPTGGPPAPADVRRHLAETLPAVMVPGHWVVLPDRLPRTPNGKLDRAALPEPPRHLPADPPGPSGTAEPSDGGGDGMIAELCAIWAEVLEVDEVRADDDLFDLGGHSLSITMIGSRIYRRYGVEIPLETFFDAPSAAEIAEILRSGCSTR